MKLKALLTTGVLLFLMAGYFVGCFFFPTMCFKCGVWRFQYDYHLRKNAMISVEYTQYLDEGDPWFFRPGDPIIWNIEHALKQPLSVDRYEMHGVLAGGVATLIDIGDQANTRHAEELLTSSLGRGGKYLDGAIRDALNEIANRPRP